MQIEAAGKPFSSIGVRCAVAGKASLHTDVLIQVAGKPWARSLGGNAFPPSPTRYHTAETPCRQAGERFEPGENALPGGRLRDGRAHRHEQRALIDTSNALIEVVKKSA